ncbi:MAG: YfhO family protein [Chitinophagales bacterium]|nr:YfhO family protein [Chitinophagales bacterium]
MTKKLPSVIFPILLILIVPLLAFWQLTFGVYTMKWDIMDQFFPCRYFLSECFKSHQLPLWCPYINFGYPFYADPQGGLFYPVTWIVSLSTGYNASSITAEFLLHVLIAAFSFYLLLTHFKLQKITASVFGICYALSGVFVSNAQHLSWIISMAWMPLVLVCFLKVLSTRSWKTTLLLGVSAYLMLTGGYPAFIILLFYTLLIIFTGRLIEVIRRREFAALKNTAVHLIVAGSIAVALSMGFLYSLWQALPHVDRGNSISEFEANTIPFTLQALVSILFPFVTACRSFPMFTDVSMTNIYGGILLLPFAVVALAKQKLPKVVWLLLAVGAVYFLAAFGNALPVRSWLYHALPGMDVFRHAAIFRVVSLFALLCVAAYGFDYILQHSDNLLFIRTVIALLLLLLVVFIVSLFKNSFFYAFPPSLNADDWNYFNETRSALTHLLAQATMQIALLSFVVVAFLFQRLKPFRVPVLSFVICADVALAAQMNVPSTVVSTIPVKEYNAMLQTLPKDFPVPSLKPVGDVSHLGNGETQPTWYNTSLLYKRPAKDGFNNFFLKGMPSFHASEAGKRWMQFPVAFFTEETDGNKVVPDTMVSYGIQKFGPNEFAFEYSADRETHFVLLQSKFPGWLAFCDNAEIPITAIEKMFMTVTAPSGTHRLKFVFEPSLISALFAFTAFSFFAVLLFLLFLHFMKRNELLRE